MFGDDYFPVSISGKRRSKNPKMIPPTICFISPVRPKLNNSKIFKRALLTFSGIAASTIIFYIITTPKSYAIQDKEVFEDFIETYYLEDFESYEIFSMLDENEIQTTFVYNSKP